MLRRRVSLQCPVIAIAIVIIIVIAIAMVTVTVIVIAVAIVIVQSAGCEQTLVLLQVGMLLPLASALTQSSRFSFWEELLSQGSKLGVHISRTNSDVALNFQIGANWDQNLGLGIVSTRLAQSGRIRVRWFCF